MKNTHHKPINITREIAGVHEKKTGITGIQRISVEKSHEAIGLTAGYHRLRRNRGQTDFRRLVQDMVSLPYRMMNMKSSSSGGA